MLVVCEQTQIIWGMKDIYITTPDGDIDFDGCEETESPEEVAQREWEESTLNW